MPVNFSLSQTRDASVHVPKQALALLKGVTPSNDPTNGGIAQAVRGGIDSNKRPSMNATNMLFVIDMFFSGYHSANGAEPYTVLMIVYGGKYYNVRGYPLPGFATRFAVDKVQLLGIKQVNDILAALHKREDNRLAAARGTAQGTVTAQNPPQPTASGGPLVPINPDGPVYGNQVNLPTLTAQHGQDVEDIYHK